MDALTGGTSLDDIAERLKLLRSVFDENQRQFCLRVGIGTTAWNNYEVARSLISVAQTMKLVRRVGVTSDWIYYGIMGGLPADLATKLASASDARRVA